MGVTPYLIGQTPKLCGPGLETWLGWT